LPPPFPPFPPQSSVFLAELCVWGGLDGRLNKVEKKGGPVTIVLIIGANEHLRKNLFSTLKSIYT